MPYPSQNAPADQLNPYAAPASDARLVVVDPQSPTAGPRRTAALTLASIIVLGTIPAAAVACWDIESIVVSGAIFALSSIVLLILAAPRPLRSLAAIAVATLLFILGCFLTISGLKWSPSDAQQPIGSACVVFAAVSQIAWLIIRAVRRQSAALGQLAEVP